MVQVCPVCRDVVHVHLGYFVRHGVHDHSIFSVCSGSGAPVCSVSDSCCG